MGYGLPKRKKLTIPYYPSEDDRGHNFDIVSLELKLIRDYTGLDFFAIQELNIFDYWLFLRDAFIYGKMQSPGGDEYLQNCERLQCTEPDRERLRSLQKGGTF